jgi:competence protein ComEC
MLIRRGLSLSLTIAERYDLKKIASLATLPFLLFYLLISGMGVPALRAFIMVSVVMIATVLNRRALSMRLLACAACLILLIQPESLLSASFALSFAAVIGLIAVYQEGWIPLQRWVLEGGWGRQGIAYLLGIILTTCVASAVTTPLSMAIFNRLSLQAILGNLVAIPLTGFFIMPVLLALVLSFPFGGNALLGTMASRAIDLLTETCLFTASLPGASIPIHQPPSAFLWLFILGVLWLLLWKENWRYWGIIPLFLSFCLLFVPQPPMIIIDTKGYVAWYDGQNLSNFADNSNPFTEEMIKRHFGLEHMIDEVTDRINLTILGTRVALLNGRHQRKGLAQKMVRSENIDLCRKNDLIITRYPLRIKCRPGEASVIETPRHWNNPVSAYILFSPNGYQISQGNDHQGQRPWSLN